MTENKNFKWLANDIDSTLVLKVVCKKDNIMNDYAVFNVSDVLEGTGEKLEVKTANIDDLTNLLTVGIVRFVNISNTNDILDIPFRNLYMLYENGNVLGETGSSKLLSFKELDVFSVINGSIGDDYFVYSIVISNVSDGLNKVMKIASEFGNYDMQKKFDALTDITMINHRRLVIEQENDNLK